MMSPSQQEYRQLMNENLNGDTLQKKIISFNEKPPIAPEGLSIFICSGNCMLNIC